MLSKSWKNFMFWIILYLRKLNKYKLHFSDHILYQDHTNGWRGQAAAGVGGCEARRQSGQ